HPESFADVSDGPGNLGKRIRGRLAKLPHRKAGQGRHGIAYNFACWLVRDLKLRDETALGWLQEWDRGNSPALGEAELKEVVACAHAYGQHAYGRGLADAPVLTATRRKNSRGHTHSTIRFTVRV